MAHCGILAARMIKPDGSLPPRRQFTAEVKSLLHEPPEILIAGSLFPVRLSCRASNNALAMLSGIYTSLSVTSPSSLTGLGGDAVTC